MKNDFDQDRSLKGWQRFIQSGELMYNIPAPIARSWMRCQGKRLPAVKLLPKSLGLLPTINKKPQHLLAPPFKEHIYPLFDLLSEDKLLLAIVDSTGGLIVWKGNEGFLLTGNLCNEMNFQEESLGTMAIGLALKEKLPYITRGAEHYYSCYHGLVNYAVPLEISGDFLGVLGGWSTLEHGDFMTAIVSLGQKLLLVAEI